MNTRHSFRWLWLTVSAVFLALPFTYGPGAAQSEGNAVIKTAGGLTLVTFDIDPGKIIVRLPDDIRAGDTISGTVVTEPKGNTAEEKAKNQNVLNTTVLDLGGTKIPADRPMFRWTPVIPQPDMPVRYQLRIFEILGRFPEGTTQPRVVIPLDATITQPGAVTSPNPATTPIFNLPTLGQTGRPIVITGPFDGNASNTVLRFGPARSTTEDFEKNTENVSGGFGLIRPLAESPRKMVFESPTTATGVMRLQLTERDIRETSDPGNKISIGPAPKETGKPETINEAARYQVTSPFLFRNLGVNLSAPKTNLLKGERTTLTVQVTGLTGIKQPVPLTLTYGGVIIMEGGPYQPLLIQPSQVSADGRYTTTRAITGVQAGGWTATATVVTGRFDSCLQDDKSGLIVFLNSVDGAYAFPTTEAFSGSPTQGSPRSKPIAATPEGKPVLVVKPDDPASGATVPPTGGTTGETGKSGGTTTTPSTGGNARPLITLTGTGTMARKGCVIVLTHNAPDRRVFARLDVCTNSGDAKVETTSPKTNVTITDRNISDNTCPSK